MGLSVFMDLPVSKVIVFMYVFQFLHIPKSVCILSLTQVDKKLSWWIIACLVTNPEPSAMEKNMEKPKSILLSLLLVAETLCYMTYSPCSFRIDVPAPFL